MSARERAIAVDRYLRYGGGFESAVTSIEAIESAIEDAVSDERLNRSPIVPASNLSDTDVQKPE